MLILSTLQSYPPYFLCTVHCLLWTPQYPPQAFIPEVIQPGLDYPLLACDIEGFDPEYISWDGDHASNSLFVDAARDIEEICPHMLTNMNGSLFSVCKIYPTKDNPDPTDKIDEGDNCDGIMWVELVSQRLSKRVSSASAVIVPLSYIPHSTVLTQL
jgi:hypothetical protein